MSKPVLRGVTTGTPTGGVATVATASGTITGDTVFVAQALNYRATTDMTGPTATGITWDAAPIKRVKYGNALLAVWRGKVDTNGVKTISLPQNAGTSSNFPMCFTYNGDHLLDGAATDFGNAAGTATVAVPAVTTVEATSDLLGFWSVITFSGAHAGQMIDNPATMDSERFQVPHYSDNAMELTAGRQQMTFAGSTGSRTATLRDAANTAWTDHVGFAGVMFAVKRVSTALPPIVGAGADATIVQGQTFSRVATENANGSGISERGWRIVSAPAGGPAPGTVIDGDTFLDYIPNTVGSYVLEYFATNAGGTSADSLTLTVTQAPPTAIAGADVSFEIGNSFNRNGQETGTGITAFEWRVISGPSNVGEVMSASRGISWVLPSLGQYELEYAVTNPAGTGRDRVFVTTTPPPVPPAELNDGWTYVRVPWGEEEFTLRDQLPGQQFEFQIRAVDASTPPNMSPYSESVFAETAADTQPPSIPAAGEVAASRMAVQVLHRLGKSTGGEFNLEADLNHLKVHVGTAPDFATNTDPVDVPGGTYAGMIPASVGDLIGEIPVVGTFPIPQTDEVWVKVVAVDSYGNESLPSAGVQATAELLDSAYISSLTVSKVIGGTILANWVQAAEMSSGTVGSRWRLGYFGLEFYNANNQLTLDANTSDGSVYLIGTVATGRSGRRVVINGETNAIEFMPEIGETRKARIYAYIPNNFPNDIVLEMRSIDSDTADFSARVYVFPDRAAMTVSPHGEGGDLLSSSFIEASETKSVMGARTIIGTAPFVGSDQTLRAQISVQNGGQIFAETWADTGVRQTLFEMSDTLIGLGRTNSDATYDGGYFQMRRADLRTLFGHKRPGGESWMEFTSDGNVKMYRNNTLRVHAMVDGVENLPYTLTNLVAGVNAGRMQMHAEGGGAVFWYWTGGSLCVGTGSSFIVNLSQLGGGNIINRLNNLESHVNGGLSTGHHIH